MLNPLIEHIDSEFSMFNKQYGLAERVSEESKGEGENEDLKTFPAVYIGRENYDPVNIEGEVSYHRINGTRQVERNDENASGCAKGIQITYPMIMVGVVKLTEDNQYEFEEISNVAASTLMGVMFDKATRRELNAWSIELNVASINSDRTTVWNNEFEGVPMQMNFNYALFSIGYDLIIKADSSCLNKC